MVFELWVSPDGSETSLFGSGEQETSPILVNSVYDVPMDFVATFASSSWTRARADAEAILESVMIYLVRPLARAHWKGSAAS